MRLPSPPVILLVALGVALAAANFATTFGRTTIPRAFAGTVVAEREMRDLRPGLDTVYHLELSTGDTLEVTEEVLALTEPGARINKTAMSTTLNMNGLPYTLTWSADCSGMAIAMPILIVIAVVLGFLAGDGRQEEVE